MLDWIAVAFWILLAGGQLAMAIETRAVMPLLLTTQAVWVAYRLLKRRLPDCEAGLGLRLLAWCSALLPLVLRAPHQTLLCTLLFLTGMALLLSGLAALGASFGIAPADRGLVSKGPYRWLRHPMYAGELLTVLGALSANPSPWNAGVFVALTIAIVLRIQAEERLISGYAGYRQRVRWRLIPLIW